VRQKIHPTSVIAGYRLAAKECAKYVEKTMSRKVEDLGKECIMNVAMTSMSSKIVGMDAAFFAGLVVDACEKIKTFDDLGDVKYPINRVNILKAHGKSARESEVLDGYALNLGRSAQGMPMQVINAKIACLDFNLQKTKMLFGIQVLVNDPRELERIREEESAITARRIQLVLKAGANVILCTKGIDDMALKYFVEAGAIACRRVPKEDLKRIARATGATILSSLSDMEGNESFDPTHLGEAKEVCETRVSDDEMMLIKGCKSSQACTMLLRGANDYFLDEIDRSLHDALCVVKRCLESGSVVPGGGCVEAALSVHLEQKSVSLGSREQLAVAEFAEAMLCIPKTLAVNAAKDSTELVAKLRAYHFASQTREEDAHYINYGLDLYNGELRDNLLAGVLEPTMSKVKSFKFATEAAITILRIDDMIKLDKQDDGGRDGF
jgi:T-complex protein 1 subunit alpha